MREACRLPIYLDHLASTPLDPAVRAAMLPWLEAGAAGNPHSEHAAGWRAAKAVEAARESVAALIGAGGICMCREFCWFHVTFVGFKCRVSQRSPDIIVATATH